MRKNNDSMKLAGAYYDHEMKKKADELSTGLSITHEQVMDNYTEGTIDGVIEKDGKTIPLKKRNK